MQELADCKFALSLVYELHQIFYIVVDCVPLLRGGCLMGVL